MTPKERFLSLLSQHVDEKGYYSRGLVTKYARECGLSLDQVSDLVQLKGYRAKTKRMEIEHVLKTEYAGRRLTLDDRLDLSERLDCSDRYIENVWRFVKAQEKNV